MSGLRMGIAAAAAVLISSPLAAQQGNSPAPQNAPSTESARPAGPGAPNVAPSRRDEPGSSSATTSTPPVGGANSFTESQARDRIASSGFSNVKDLKKDGQGVWRGQAQKDGQSVGVALDYRGNVVQQ